MGNAGRNGGEYYTTRPLIRAMILVLASRIGETIYACTPLTREERASLAKIAITDHFIGSKRAFLEFVLSHYVDAGVDELAREKLTPLLKLRYHDSLADAVADLGRPDEIGQAFAGFQKHLYSEAS